tara:strand:- start:356 stop:1741 length:1386 start_codon:yes stop_codon:yes gene_type:complete
MNTSRVLPSSQNKETFKAHLRSYKNVFSSPILSARFEEVSPIMLSYASGITSATNVDVALFDNAGTIVVGVGSTSVSGNNLIYLPGLENDFVNLQVGGASTTINFTSTGISIGGTSYGVGGGFSLEDKFFTVKGVGGTLLQSGNTPAYSITESSTSVNEGSSVSFTVNTTDVGAGTTLYFNATGGQVDAADFSDGSLSGNFQIIGTGTTTGVATFVRSIATDFNTENETFSMQIRTGSVTGPVVATSNVITIGDVVATFSVAESATTVNEGGSVTFTLSGNNIPAGTYYYTIYEIEGVVAAADFNPAATSGSFTVSNNSGTLTLTLTEDRTTEGVDKFKVQFRRDSISGTVIAESNTITIGDVSRSVGENANGLTFGPVQVNRDNGNPANTSDWYTICDLDNVPDGSSIALFIDGSGSMRQSNVQASYDLLISKLNARGITITTVTNSNEDWITPFLVNLP